MRRKWRRRRVEYSNVIVNEVSDSEPIAARHELRLKSGRRGGSARLGRESADDIDYPSVDHDAAPADVEDEDARRGDAEVQRERVAKGCDPRCARR